MPSAQENAATMRRGYELFNSGNLAELQGLFTEDTTRRPCPPAAWEGSRSQVTNCVTMRRSGAFHQADGFCVAVVRLRPSVGGQ
jgi:ketosteroid isomerase-like protein